jgi:hypothetical protein
MPVSSSVHLAPFPISADVPLAVSSIQVSWPEFCMRFYIPYPSPKQNALGAAFGNVRHSCCRISPEITPDSNLTQANARGCVTSALTCDCRQHCATSAGAGRLQFPTRVYLDVLGGPYAGTTVNTLESCALNAFPPPATPFLRRMNFFCSFCWGHRGSAISGCDILRLYELRMRSTTEVLYRVTLFRAPPLATIGRNVCVKRGEKYIVRSVGDGTFGCWMYVVYDVKR